MTMLVRARYIAFLVILLAGAIPTTVQGFDHPCGDLGYCNDCEIGEGYWVVSRQVVEIQSARS
jgi:hypothetical protein